MFGYSIRIPRAGVKSETTVIGNPIGFYFSDALFFLIIFILSGFMTPLLSFGGLQVTCDLGPARVYVDGKYFGKTPFYTTDVPPGEHRMKVTLDTEDIWQGTIHVPTIHTLFVKARRGDLKYYLDSVRRRNRRGILGGAFLSSLLYPHSGAAAAFLGAELYNEIFNRPWVLLDPKTGHFVSRRSWLKDQAEYSEDGSPLSGGFSSPKGFWLPEVSVEMDRVDERGPCLEIINYSLVEVGVSVDCGELNELRLAPLQRKRFIGIRGNHHCVISMAGHSDRTLTIEMADYQETTISIRAGVDSELLRGHQGTTIR